MRKLSVIPAEFAYLLRVFLVSVFLFSLLRLGLLLRNLDLAANISPGTLLHSFLVGARFDIMVASYLVFPWALWLIVPRFGWQYQSIMPRFLPWGLSILLSPVLLLGLAEWEFYREFHDRFNQLALEYIKDDPATVVSMLWNGFPVVPYLLLWLAATVLIGLALKRSVKMLMPEAHKFGWEKYFKRVLPAGVVVIVLLIIGARGGITNSKPLRWGDAYFSSNTFANHLASNGIFTLSRTVLEQKRHNLSRYWITKLRPDDAVNNVRALVLQKDDRLVRPDTYPLLRMSKASGEKVIFASPPRHLVIILMESFSAEFVGAFGASYNVTPSFDRLARQGILFDRFFSQGTHTHQGVFATIGSFPNLPGFEYLMKHSLAQQPFRSFISMLGEEGFNCIYIYNGDFAWDNQKGFFWNQGMRQFIGRDDYINPTHKNSTWGVSDEDMFMRSIGEIRRMTKDGSTFAFLQTLSNHAPFNLPPPAPFTDIKSPGDRLPRLNGMKYSDWALGQFMKRAREEPWFSETLFVILGDHGFASGPPGAAIDLSCYHIPLLIYYPGDTRYAGQRNHTVGSQVDVMPTVLGLMGISRIHQAWGRDLFRVGRDDPGWAVVKPSGSRQVVGFISGDTLLVASPAFRPSTYKFLLNPVRIRPITLPDASVRHLSDHLYGYVQTSLTALRTSRAGIPARIR